MAKKKKEEDGGGGTKGKAKGKGKDEAPEKKVERRISDGQPVVVDYVLLEHPFAGEEPEKTEKPNFQLDAKVWHPRRPEPVNQTLGSMEPGKLKK